MSTNFGRGLHAAPGRAVSLSAYDRYLGRWSRLFVPAVLAAAEVTQGSRVLGAASGTGEAAAKAIPIVGDAGFVVDADISLEMVKSARARLDQPLYWPVNADGQELPFKDDAFDAVVCQLGLQFFSRTCCGPDGVPACRSNRRDGDSVRQQHIGPTTYVGQSGRRGKSIYNTTAA